MGAIIPHPRLGREPAKILRTTERIDHDVRVELVDHPARRPRVAGVKSPWEAMRSKRSEDFRTKHHEISVGLSDASSPNAHHQTQAAGRSASAGSSARLRPPSRGVRD